MQIKKKNDNKQFLLSLIFGIFLSLVLSLFFTMFINLGYDPASMLHYLKTHERASYKLADMSLIDFEADDAAITSASENGQLHFIAGRYIYDLNVKLKQKLTANTPVMIYYTYNGTTFNDEDRIDLVASANSDSFTCNINHYADIVRIDIGEEEGQTFYLDEVTVNERNPLADIDFWIGYLCIFLLLFFIALHFILDIKTMYDFLYRYRFAVGAALIFFGVAFNLNGSSLSAWNKFVSVPDSNTVFGQAQILRTDEWATFTPFTFSQSYGEHPYSWFNTIIRATDTDTFIVYAQPVAHIFSILFRPFLTGFMIFGISRGLAFFWWARFVCLWLAIFELGMLITKRNKLLSALGAILVSLAPVLQWWFAINGLVEMLFFGSVAILMVHNYMTDSKILHRLIYLFVIYCCGGGYIMTFYPAWMVPLAYAFLALLIWVFAENFKNCQMKWYDFLSIAVTVCLLGLSLFYIFNKSGESINLTLNTAYPGKRVETGGGYGAGFYIGYGNLLFLFNNKPIPYSNFCETAVFLDLFPLGILMGCYAMARQKKKDLLLILLIIMEGILAAFITFGFPEILAKITLLSFSLNNHHSSRVIIASGFINILILLRAASMYRREFSTKTVYLISGVYILYILLGSYAVYGNYLDKLHYVIIAALSFTACYFLLKMRAHLPRLTAFMLILLLVGASMVNPLQRGTANVTNSSLALAIQNIAKEDSEGKWIVDALDFPMINYPLIQGAKTINCTNTYPDLERWKKISDHPGFEELYNRYAHILVDVITEEEAANLQQSKFTLIGPDKLKVVLSVSELKKLEVNYILTQRDFSQLEFGDNTFTLLSDTDGYKIYKLNY